MASAHAGPYFISLKLWYGEKVSCTDETCEGVLTYGRSKQGPYVHSENLGGNAALGVTADDYPECGVIGNAITNAQSSGYCAGPHRMFCQSDCNVGMCPKDHPFAIDNGNGCCSSYVRKIEGSCDGQRLTYEDPTDCCPNDDWIPCDTVLGCKNHELATGKFIVVEKLLMYVCKGGLGNLPSTGEFFSPDPIFFLVSSPYPPHKPQIYTFNSLQRSNKCTHMYSALLIIYFVRILPTESVPKEDAPRFRYWLLHLPLQRSIQIHQKFETLF